MNIPTPMVNKVPKPILPPQKVPYMVPSMPVQSTPKPIQTIVPHVAHYKDTPLPILAKGAVVEYFLRYRNGTVEKLDQATIDLLKKNGQIHPDGGLTTKAQTFGLSLRVVPPTRTFPTPSISNAIPSPILPTQRVPYIVPPLPSMKTPTVAHIAVPPVLENSDIPLPKLAPGASIQYFSTNKLGKAVPLSQTQVKALVSSGHIHPDGALSTQAKSWGLIQMIVPPNPSPIKTPTLVTQLTPTPKFGTDIPLPKLPVGATIQYFLRQRSGLVFKVSGNDVDSLKASGLIHPDGAISTRGIAVGLSFLVSPYKAVTQIPNPILPAQQTPYLVPNPLHLKSPSIVSYSIPSPIYAGKVPNGASVQYFSRSKNGAVIKLGKNDIKHLQKNKLIKPNGLLTSLAIAQGFSYILTPPLKITAPVNNTIKTTVHPPQEHSVEVKPANVTSIYHAPFIGLEDHLLGPQLTKDQVQKMYKNGLIHPDGSLSSISISKGYRQIILLDSLPSLFSSLDEVKNIVQAAFLPLDHDMKNKLDTYRKSQQVHPAREGVKGYIWWILLLIFAYGAYRKWKKVKKEQSNKAE